jgi:transposase
VCRFKRHWTFCGRNLKLPAEIVHALESCRVMRHYLARELTPAGIYDTNIVFLVTLIDADE